MSLKQYLSITEYLKSDTLTDLPDDHIRNINILIPKVNDLLEKFGSYRPITSGYRSKEDQIRIYKQKLGAAYNISKVPMGSCHLVGLAVDLADANADLYRWLKANEQVLEDLGLYCEERMGGWQHIQAKAPKSGKRWFLP